ncbi:MAG: hypothetical protein IIC60_15175 [Proteobacteria bacterium]|nr:hypothetical protein [Pseudomonadota bacterium]
MHPRELLLKVVLVLAGIIVFICWFGFFLVNPNEGRVLQLFGKYVGSEMQPGLRWANPLYTKAGVEVIEARISHLAYAPEIASAMLQRQQASAIVAARHKIVEGAVGMVELALDSLAKKKVVHLDEERKAAMVSNLLVVLCGDAMPVINTGSLYT